jgi:tight adherence protein C
VLEPLLASGGRLVRRLSPSRRILLTRDRIVYAGLEGSLTVEKVFAYKAVASVLGLLLGLLGGPAQIPTLVWAIALALLASFVPDVVLSSRASARQTAIARALPEALDLLALTVEAGLGFEQALEVVVDNSTGPLTGELTRLLREVELGVPRREALAALRDRTDVPELSSFVVALVQSDQMGIALADVLKTQAAQVRLKRRQRAKEQAAKTPVKILFPVVLGIFPALFVVTVGPGAIQIAKTLI